MGARIYDKDMNALSPVTIFPKEMRLFYMTYYPTTLSDVKSWFISNYRELKDRIKYLRIYNTKYQGLYKVYFDVEEWRYEVRKA